MQYLLFPSLFFLVIYLQHPSDLLAQETAATKYFQRKSEIQVKPFSFEAAHNGHLVVSNLDNFRDLYASSKYLLTQLYNSDYKTNYKYIQDTGRLQKQLSPDAPFPCGLNNTRSTQPPSSVHELRPGDIDIIAAMGDSLTAGTAMMSKTFLQVMVEFRGQTALGGGLKDWRTFLTLPNILKVFNPNLYGFAIANTLAKFREARFNVAEPFAITQDMPYMAQVLIKRLQSDPKVNMSQHWKLISILIGANDICNDLCHYDKLEDFLEGYRKDLHKTLTTLRDNIPRLMINIIIVPDIVDILQGMTNVPAYCDSLRKAYCHCFISSTINSKQLKERHDTIQRLQQISIDVASLDEFQLKEFAVVPRTFALNKMFRASYGRNSYLAIDCFHFSQYGNAAFTTMFWNDMLQVKSKPSETFIKPFEIFSCPSEKEPYISTLRN